MIIDAHTHLWHRARAPQPWIDPDSMLAPLTESEHADTMSATAIRVYGLEGSRA
jgi:predicted TIM-barrel fold metal-dependent hydrolase